MHFHTEVEMKIHLLRKDNQVLMTNHDAGECLNEISWQGTSFL